MHKLTACLFASVLVAGQFAPPVAAIAASSDYPTTTQIKHLVMIFQENVSFDHSFGMYPTALNPAGEPAFFDRLTCPVFSTSANWRFSV